MPHISGDQMGVVLQIPNPQVPLDNRHLYVERPTSMLEEGLGFPTVVIGTPRVR